MVLGHNLVSATPIKVTEKGFTLSSTQYDHLAMSPDIARLAHDIFYCEISFEPNTPTNNQIKLPPIPLRPLIERLTLNMDLCKSH
jgi:hypothetical protein